MPAHVEVVSPESLILTNNDYGDILSELTRRLHKYDEVVRVVQMEKDILEKKVEEYFGRKKKISIQLCWILIKCWGLD